MTAAVQTAHSVIPAPRRHTVPQAAKDLRDSFRAFMWHTAIDSWLSRGREYAALVTISDPVRIEVSWSTGWGSVDWMFDGAEVKVRGANHPATDFCRINPQFPELSKGASIELWQAVAAAALSGPAAEKWANDRIKEAS